MKNSGNVSVIWSYFAYMDASRLARTICDGVVNKMTAFLYPALIALPPRVTPFQTLALMHIR
jgi:hypothetical protein